VTQLFEDVYRTYAPRIYRFCLTQVRDPGDAEDLAADVFAKAFRAYGRVRPDPAGTLTWLLRIARNTILDHHRKHRRRGAALLRLLPRPPAPATEHVVALRAELRVALARLADLSERDQVLVGLRVAGELTFAEVGAVLGISEHAATMATHRALDRLRKLTEAAT
jgi:RNA polymerase sigma-70 factor, ECF subfamily